jgi:hypothetical protein
LRPPGGARAQPRQGNQETEEVFRHLTGLIASVEENNPDYTWDDIAVELEDHGFHAVDFLLGPALD